jgi:hypothetical protein
MRENEMEIIEMLLKDKATREISLAIHAVIADKAQKSTEKAWEIA